jgi:hypothetical protein
MDGRGHDPMTFKRNLQSLAVLLLVHGRSACLFFGQTGGKGATLLPERVIFEFCPSIRSFKWQSIIFIEVFIQN